ncbi:MAG: hypothetical protein QM739_11415 [Propionivibrio sp.]
MSIMCPERFSRRSRQFGFAIVSALFIIVALAALGAFIAVVSGTQQIGNTLDLMGARAYQAARAGTEWGIANAINNSTCIASGNIGTFNGVAVTVNCATVATGAADEVSLGSIYRITAIACSSTDVAGACPGDAAVNNYVERRLTVLVER